MTAKKSRKKPERSPYIAPKKVVPRTKPGITHRPQYSDEYKANALTLLSAYEGNVYRTAKELEIPYYTLYFWSKGSNINEAALQMYEVRKSELADKLEAWASQLIDIMPERLQTANLVAMSTSLGIAIDKMRLLRNESTSNTSTTTTSLDPANKELIDAMPYELRKKMIEALRKKREEQERQSAQVIVPANAISFQADLPEDEDE